MSKLYFAIILREDFVESVVIQMVVLDHFLGIELYLPEQQLQAVVHVQVFLSLVYHPNIKVRWLVNDFLDIKNKVTHTLCSPHLFVEVTTEHAIDTLHLLLEGG